MKKLHEALQHKLLPGLIGIEIECEGQNLVPIDDEFWKTEDDGSLRGSFPEERSEYVLKKPIPHSKVGMALDNLIEAEKKAKLNFSFRTSVHIHVNCGDLEANQVSSFAYSYLLFERILMRYCGEERNANRFCLRLRDAEQQLDAIEMFINRGFDALYHFHGDRMRYASMNLASLAKYGSIEFRGMRGTMDKHVLTTWVDSLVALRKFSLKFANPMEMYRHVASVPFHKLFEDVFGNTGKELQYNGMERDFLEGVSLSIEIPFGWRRAEKQRIEFVKVEQKVAKEKFKVNVNPAEIQRPAFFNAVNGGVIYQNPPQAIAAVDQARMEEEVARLRGIRAHQRDMRAQQVILDDFNPENNQF